MSGPVPAWMEAAIFGWTSLLPTASTFTWAPVSFTNPSSTCFLKYGSDSGTKPAESRTDRVVPFRLGAPLVVEDGAAWVAPAAGFAASAGLAAAAGCVG